MIAWVIRPKPGSPIQGAERAERRPGPGYKLSDGVICRHEGPAHQGQGQRGPGRMRRDASKRGAHRLPGGRAAQPDRRRRATSAAA